MSRSLQAVRDMKLNTSSRLTSLLDNKGLGRAAAVSRTRHLQTTAACPQQQPAYRDELPRQHAPKLLQKLAERDLFLSVLGATTTKRDAKSYLSRFQPKTTGNKAKEPAEEHAVLSTPPIRIALVKIKSPQTFDAPVLQGLAHTLSQLSRLGLNCIIVVDCDEDDTALLPATWRQDAIIQADRIVRALDKEANTKARRVDISIGLGGADRDVISNMTDTNNVYVQYPNLITGAISGGSIPVIPAIGYLEGSQRMTAVAADDVMLALARQFSVQSRASGGNVKTRESASADNTSAFTIERIILLDPRGGLPSAFRKDKSHVFINLKQEYEEVRQELLGADFSKPKASTILAQEEPKARSSVFGASNPFTKLLESEQPLPTTSLDLSENVVDHNTVDHRAPRNRNVKNLDLLQRILSILPTSSSALLTTPEEAATSSADATDLGVVTRRPKNPLIFNLLADKPIVSSSLPTLRLGPSLEQRDTGFHINNATFFKFGMPLAVIPDPKVDVWKAPGPSQTALSLDRIGMDLPRLVHLIEDSFGRPLDVDHYLNRIRNKLAGVIIAGDYEGGAILTWELPPGVPDDGSEESRQRMVPYLDKFAVLRRSQGSGGVADIVFSAMVRSCFPNGVCWRSRKNNPVNKWYFERSHGTWKIPGTNWTMFWTTTHLFETKQLFHDYESVCRSVLPSWADKKNIAD